MQNWTGVVPITFPKPKIAHLRNAISIPQFGRLDSRNLFGSGIFHPDGTPVDTSLNMVSGHGAMPAKLGAIPERARLRAGAWLFGGLLLNHFGHTLIDSTSRLWAVDHLFQRGVPLRGVLFFNKKVKSETDEQTIPKTSAAVFAVFHPNIPIVCGNAIESIEDLYIPEPGISSGTQDLIGRPEQQRFFRDCAAKIPPAGPPQDIYISRTGGGARGSHLFEDVIEQAFAAEGYVIFKPEHHSITEQIATYRAARRLVSIDGSALHLAAMSVPLRCKVAVLSRRQFYAWAIADQFRAFADCDVTVIEAHSDVYNLASNLRDPKVLRSVAGWSSSYVMTNFAHLGQELVRAGFFEKAPIWPEISAVQLAEVLDRLSAKTGDRLALVPPDLQALEPHFHAHLHVKLAKT